MHYTTSGSIVIYILNKISYIHLYTYRVKKNPPTAPLLWRFNFFSLSLLFDYLHFFFAASPYFSRT